jgi:phage replication-related protein YjqB (UPF0714/DUF867 family)
MAALSGARLTAHSRCGPMAGDKYGSFAELQNREREGVDFSIRVMPLETSAAIIAPHGGMIEPGTSDIAAAIAGNDYGLYCFEGLRAVRTAICTSRQRIFANRNASSW